MRNVMVRCIFSVLIVGLSHVLKIHAQERHVQWTDQQVLADEWQPFVPNFVHDRQFQNYPRSDTPRQFFGKNVEAVHNSLKKSFQTSSGNNVEQYAVPPILGSFNSYTLQTVQTRNPILDKNIKDGQFLDQSSHFSPKYHPQSVQQPLHRFPAYISPLPQYQQPNNQYHQTVNQYQHYQNNNQFLNRLEAPLKPTSLLQAPSRTISTSVQVFPPNQQNHFPSNGYFIGVPPKSENFNEEDPLARKQSRPNDFLVNNNNIATIYGSKDPGLSISPPALKSAPFVRNEPVQNNFLFDNVKAPPERYEIANNYHKLAINEPQPVNHMVETNKKMVEETNPSKQVYEQLSHFGRPFSLPKETVTEYNRVKPERNTEIEGLIHSYSAPLGGHYKKEKMKPSHQQYSHSKNIIGRFPINSIYESNLASTPANQIVDYEPGKLQSVKTVTYVPQKDIVQFNEEDVSSNINQYQYEDLTKTPFLPTPTESNDDIGGFIHYERYTTPAYEITSKLPQNHKYSNQYHAAIRNRHHPVNEIAPHKYFMHSTESEINSQFLDDRMRYTSSTPRSNYENEYTEMTTRKIVNRRRKPSKTKTKDYNRHKVNMYVDTSTQSANEFYVSDVPSLEVTSVPQQYSTRKKVQTKYTTTTESEEDNYPNYPAHFLKQLNKQYQYDQYNPVQNQQESEDVTYNSEKDDGKENYPVFSAQSTTTKAPEVTTVSLKRVKNKYVNSTRPRFSIKDYKRTTTLTPLTTTSTATETITDYQIELEKKNNRKNLFASRLKNKTESSSTEKDETASEPSRKYKPRTRPPKFRTTSTTPVPETTSERVNTFKPSTSNRYRSTTSKYYNRFRTTSEITNNDADDAATSSSDKKPVRTMLYSAKRSSILRPKSTTTPKVEDNFEDDEYENDAEGSTNVVTLKKHLYRLKTTPKLEKADDVSETSIMTSSEEQAEKDKLKNKTTEAAAKETNAITTVASSEEEFDENDEEVEDIDEILTAMKENEITTESASNSSTVPVADDRNDDAEKVSKVSSLTSTDESNLPISFYRKWSSNDNQNE